MVSTAAPGEDLAALDHALHALAAVDERKARVIELRFFGGLSVEETAAILKVSGDTVMRDWKLAKAWLFRELKASGQRAKTAAGGSWYSRHKRRKGGQGPDHGRWTAGNR